MQYIKTEFKLQIDAVLPGVFAIFCYNKPLMEKIYSVGAGSGTWGRRERLRVRCLEKKVDGYLTFDFSDVLYLSSFPSEGCFFLGSQAGDFLFAPALLSEQARALSRGEKGLSVITASRLLKALEEVVHKNRLKKIGYDTSKVTVSLARQLERIKKVQWSGLEGFVLSQRMVKDEGEIEKISKACRLSVRSWQAVFRGLKVGQSEEETAYSLENLFREGGSPKPAFETIVAFNEHAAFPHHVATKKKLSRHSTVLMDLGSTQEGYKSDLTRTGFFGKMNRKFSKIYGVVKKSQEEGIAAVRDGVTAGQVDFVCRKVISKSGYGEYFNHGTGHGVGLDIHEPPRLGIESREVLREGMVGTVEPGIYLPGEFGVRIEDTVLVTKAGCRVLTC